MQKHTDGRNMELDKRVMNADKLIPCTVLLSFEQLEWIDQHREIESIVKQAMDMFINSKERELNVYGPETAKTASVDEFFGRMQADE